MSEIQIIVLLVSSLISILGLWLLLFWLYRDYRVDAFRQEMFALRDRLFDLAADSVVPFDHPAYGMLRSAMNGLIRFGHRLTFFQTVLLVSLVGKDMSTSKSEMFRERWEKAISTVDSSVRSKLEGYRTEMHCLVLKHLVLGSPLLILTVVLPVLIWMVGQACLSWVMDRLQRPFDDIDTAAVAFGQ